MMIFCGCGRGAEGRFGTPPHSGKRWWPILLSTTRVGKFKVFGLAYPWPQCSFPDFHEQCGQDSGARAFHVRQSLVE